MKYFILLVLIFFFTSISFAQTSTAKESKILLKTDEGDVEIVLYNDIENHKENFEKLVKDGFYDGVLFHRVIKDFMIQGGDPQSKNATGNTRLGSGGPGYTIPAEILPKYFHKKGALSAARTGDQMNPTRRSSGSQFYIVTGKVMSDDELDSFEKRMNTTFTKEQRAAYTTIGGAPFLDGQYTVFGEVIKGLDVVEKIENTQTGTADRPVKDIKVIKAEIIK